MNLCGSNSFAFTIEVFLLVITKHNLTVKAALFTLSFGMQNQSLSAFEQVAVMFPSLLYYCVLLYKEKLSGYFFELHSVGSESTLD
jgi:hypothetical protein